MKTGILIFILAVLAAGSVNAHENSASSATAVSITNQADQIFDHAIDQRIIDRLKFFDPSDGGQPSRYSVELDLENEDSDWSFEVTVTVEF